MALTKFGPESPLKLLDNLISYWFLPWRFPNTLFHPKIAYSDRSVM